MGGWLWFLFLLFLAGKLSAHGIAFSAEILGRERCGDR